MKCVDEFDKRSGLTVVGKDHYGVVNGYQFSYRINPTQASSYLCCISAPIASKSQEIKNFLESKNKELKFAGMRVDPNQIIFQPFSWTGASGMKNLELELNAITSFLKENGVPESEYCPVCGQKIEQGSWVKFDEGLAYLDNACAENLKKLAVAREAEYNALPNNYGKGFIGALLGGLIGGVAWIGIGMIGFVSGWVAFLISGLASLFYDKFKGKPSGWKIVIVSGASLLVILCAQFVLYLVVVASAMEKEGISGSVVATLFDNIQNNAKFATSFWSDFGLALFFAILGILLAAWQMKYKIHKKQ
jgi:hypothetical protein